MYLLFKGQTIQKLLFDVRDNIFSHGGNNLHTLIDDLFTLLLLSGLYVALSRVRRFSNIGFIVDKESVSEDNTHIYLKNIVYKEIFN